MFVKTLALPQKTEPEKVDELRNYFRLRHATGKIMSLAEQRQLFRKRLAALQLLMQMAL
jgi:hypothetical protein